MAYFSGVSWRSSSFRSSAKATSRDRTSSATSKRYPFLTGQSQTQLSFSKYETLAWNCTSGSGTTLQKNQLSIQNNDISSRQENFSPNGIHFLQDQPDGDDIVPGRIGRKISKNIFTQALHSRISYKIKNGHRGTHWTGEGSIFTRKLRQIRRQLDRFRTMSNTIQGAFRLGNHAAI